MSKLPSFQFYPGDWQKDPALRSCSPASRGIFIDSLCLMFDCAQRGVLVTGNCVWSEKDWAAAIGGNGDVTLGCIREIVNKGVVKCRGKESPEFQEEHAELLAAIPMGAFYSWRMVCDEHKRILGRERVTRFRNGGSNAECNGNVTPMLLPSSSSISSSASTVKGGNENAAPLFEPVKRNLFPREYEQMLKAAKAQVKKIKGEIGNYELKLSRNAQDLILFIHSKREPNAESKVQEIKQDPKNQVRGDMKPQARALLEAWENRVKEIEDAMNGIVETKA